MQLLLTDCLLHLPTDVCNLLQLFRMFFIREPLPLPLQYHLHFRPRRHLRPIRANLSGRNFTEESGALSNQSGQSRDEMVPTAHLAAQRVVALRQEHVFKKNLSGPFSWEILRAIEEQKKY